VRGINWMVVQKHFLGFESLLRLSKERRVCLKDVRKKGGVVCAFRWVLKSSPLLQSIEDFFRVHPHVLLIARHSKMFCFGIFLGGGLDSFYFLHCLFLHLGYFLGGLLLRAVWDIFKAPTVGRGVPLLWASGTSAKGRNGHEKEGKDCQEGAHLLTLRLIFG